jgi:hypothetical protein
MRILLLSFLAVSTAALSSADDGASINGNWKIHTSIAGNESDIACALTQKESAVTGKCTSERGDVEMTGKITGQKVSLSYKSEYNGTPLTVVYEGTLEATAGMKGSVSVPEFGVAGDFTATQSK